MIFYLIVGLVTYAIFAWDIENDRDIYTWFWLLFAIYWFIEARDEYKKRYL